MKFHHSYLCVRTLLVTREGFASKIRALSNNQDRKRLHIAYCILHKNKRPKKKWFDSLTNLRSMCSPNTGVLLQQHGKIFSKQFLRQLIENRRPRSPIVTRCLDPVQDTYMCICVCRVCAEVFQSRKTETES